MLHWKDSLSLAWQMMRRDLRAGELHLLGLALVIAIASLTSVSFLGDRVGRALEREANQLLGGDLLLSADRPWPPDFARGAVEHGLEVADTVLLTSMASRGEAFVLAGVKAVSEAYPLRGEIRIAAAADQLEHAAPSMPASGEVWLDERLFAELGVRVGDQVTLGERDFRVSAMIRFEADRGANVFSFLPRAIFSLADLAATGLVGEGSRASWRLHVAGTLPAVEAFEQWASARLERGQRIETVANARPEVRAALDQAQRFLRLAALLAVVLAAVATGLGARRFMLRHLDACAVMRVLGLGQGRLLLVILGEFAFFAALAALLGSLCGWLVQWALGDGLAGLLGSELPPPSPWPFVHGLAVGFVLVVGFVLPQLLRLSRVSTLRVLRRELQAVEFHVLGAALFGILALFVLVLWVAGDLGLGMLVAAGFLGALAAFAVFAWVLLRLVQAVRAAVPRHSGWSYGIAALGRRQASSVIQASALALGLSALLLLALLRGDLLDRWRAMAPVDAPNRFVINIQPDQADGIRALFGAEGLEPPLIEPMVRGRLHSINGREVKAEDYADERTRRLAEREFNLSWASALPSGNVVTSGRWHGSEGGREFSVEQGLARTFALKLGDQVAFDIGGERVEAPITSVRKLDWDSMQVNFFFIAAPGMLERHPQSLITSFYLPPAQQAFIARLLGEYPNLTVIDIGEVLAQVRAMVDKLTLIVQYVFGFALLGGMIVLYAALQSTHDERQHELAVLRILGARTRQLRQALVAEFLVLGAVAGILAALGASVLATVLAERVFKLSYLPAPLPLLLTVALAVSAVLWGGWLGTRKLLTQPPLASLRALA